MDVPSVSGSSDTAPESATGFTEKAVVWASRAMMATANPLATEAGYDIGNNFIRTQLATVQGAALPFPYGGKQRLISLESMPLCCKRRG
jgi:hypothetical protein